jgi:UDPglucose--hexose-1-phosphate uridylyltransferase
MSQFRMNFLTMEWVIVAPERAKRPDEFKNKETKAPLPEFDETCPFCPGNEDKTPPEVAVKKSNGKWISRVVLNKFAAVSPDTDASRKIDLPYVSAGGFGVAEVLVESPKHNDNIVNMPQKQVQGIIELYRERYADLSKRDHIDTIVIFKNHGRKAGTSLNHPHSQIIATSMVPPQTRIPLQYARDFHDSYGLCPYCMMLGSELKVKKRIILENEHFVAFCPYASKSPFEVKISPKRHQSRFDRINDKEVASLAETLSTVLKQIYVGLGDPDYNYVIRTSPNSDGDLHYEHWRLDIVPKITTPAGFELGSGIFINTVPPEIAAEFLKKVKV